MNIYQHLLNIISEKGAAYLILIDPDKTSGRELIEFVKICEQSDVDGFLIGGSLISNGELSQVIRDVRSNCSLPAIIFPGGVNQVFPEADAILYISLISGRNAEYLIGKHVMAAPIIKKYGIEPISTGYMLIESGTPTTAEYISGSKPIPRNKPEIAAATALAAQYLGMKFIYLEGGSGAQYSVPEELISVVSTTVDIPVIVGGGIRNSETARKKVECGAQIVVTGNYFEDKSNWHEIKNFADAIHYKSK